MGCLPLIRPRPPPTPIPRNEFDAYLYQARLDQLADLVMNDPVSPHNHDEHEHDHVSSSLAPSSGYDSDFHSREDLPRIPVDVDRDLPDTPPDVPSKPSAARSSCPGNVSAVSRIWCSICLSFEDDVTSLACGHTFGTRYVYFSSPILRSIGFLTINLVPILM